MTLAEATQTATTQTATIPVATTVTASILDVQPIAVYYEHPEWFRPLFAELDRRGLPYEKLRADEQVVDPGQGLSSHYGLFLNRMSPSAWDRGHGGAVFDTLHHLEALEERGVPVFNGSTAYRLDISKTRQTALLERLGLAVPRTRAVYRREQLLLAAESLEFPLLVKPNMGGNGAGVERFVNIDELRLALETDALKAGPDGVFLVQEYHAPRGGNVVRVETLGGRFLYALRVHLPTPCSFSICPADIRRTTGGAELSATARREDEGNDATVEVFLPSAEVIAEVEKIAAAGGLDIGGVEYLESERDGRRHYYDINALSNFIADAPKVLGFDPMARLVDLLEERLIQGRLLEQAAA